jgi:hypothetical protein
MMSRFGDVRVVLAEAWYKAYRYQVASGIIIVVMTLRARVPSYIMMARYRALVSYEGRLRHATNVTKRDMYTRTDPDRGEELEGADSPPTWEEVALRGVASNRGGRRMDWVKRIRPALRRYRRRRRKARILDTTSGV